MKNEVMKLILGTLFLFGVSLLFVQCEDEAILNEVGYADLLESRGAPASTTLDLCECIAEKFPTEALSDKEKEALVFMMEEEKLARDIYKTMAEKYDVKVFANITKAESRHMEAVKCLINKYGLEDPVGEDVESVFTNPDLQYLYDSLVIRGNIDLTEALRVGATIEDLDIFDLTTLLEHEAVDNEDVKAVFENLRKGSRNHMRAFTRNLGFNDETYEVQYITEEMYTSIIEGEQERGMGICADYIDCPNGGKNGKGNNSCSGKKNGNNGQGNCKGTASGNNGPNGNGSCNGSGQGNGNGGNGAGNCNGTGNQGNGNNGNGNGNQGNGNGNGGNGNGGN